MEHRGLCGGLLFIPQKRTSCILVYLLNDLLLDRYESGDFAQLVTHVFLINILFGMLNIIAVKMQLIFR